MSIGESQECQGLRHEDTLSDLDNIPLDPDGLTAEFEECEATGRHRANQLWNRAHSVSSQFPYLLKKRVKAYGLRQIYDKLLIPVLDESGQLQSLQLIREDGSKRFLSGARIAGGRYIIGNPHKPKVVIAEGYATGATLYKVLRIPVVVAFSAWNIEAVAISIQRIYPESTLIFAADNDWQNPNNPGLTAACAAAKIVGGNVVIPDFAGLDGSDFNDLLALRGSMEFIRQWRRNVR